MICDLCRTDAESVAELLLDGPGGRLVFCWPCVARKLSGGPDTSDARALALAVLRGDESAAWGLADELLERRTQPDGFVTRAELVAALRLAGA